MEKLKSHYAHFNVKGDSVPLSGTLKLSVLKPETISDVSRV